MNKYYETAVPGLRIRIAESKDADLLFTFIREFAAYEKMSDLVTATAEGLRTNVFEKKQAEVILAEYNGTEVGFALYFHNFSTFLGKANLYLEDLYIREAFRGLGLGKAMLACLAKIAVERDCGRFDWCCLDWNEPSIRFYKSLGAIPLKEWIIFRLEGDALSEMAKKL